MKAFFKSAHSRLGTMGEMLVFLWKFKLWWLVPPVILLLLLSFLLMLTASSFFAPFIYTLF